MSRKVSSNLYLLLLAICAYVVTSTFVIFGFIGQLFYWLLFESFGRNKKAIKCISDNSKGDTGKEYYTIIVGAGFSGLGMAVKLNELGQDNYVILERRSHLGGTWYDNRYPGCACDIPSTLYSFSFEPNPNWSHFFARQAEIEAYLEYCADKYHVRQHIQFETTVIDCKWLDDRQLWQVTVQSNDQEKHFFGRTLVSGCGGLSNASFPTNIPGIDSFEGKMCHSAQWDTKIDFNKKRVAVVGTGASAIQIVPEIYKMNTSELIVFQRTPPWIIPRIDRQVTQWEKRLFARFPKLQKLIRGVIYWAAESAVLSFVYRSPTRHVFQALVHFNLKQQVKDEIFRKKLTPTWELGCKRVLISNDWYSTLQKQNVTVVTDQIREVKQHSIVTSDNVEYPVDIIIWATGFQVQKIPLSMMGMNGRSLHEQWRETMQAYRGVTVVNFPNFFILLGPNSAIGHNSGVFLIETQLNYIVEALVFMSQNGIKSISVKQNVHDRYNKELQAKLKTTVWQLGGCHSWYQDAKGNNNTVWPGFTWTYYLLLRNFDYNNYNIY
ncbi:unnamed protein product [Rotaria magnacalcarata]|uniref:Flavin-containing monooxygenase n=2 Tax=Rotaria magnacalcarata TaxID=392030 RepID=A0A816MMK3_9BILA|nr:unnamed protein product [Rotaria magnacalcarata]